MVSLSLVDELGNAEVYDVVISGQAGFSLHCNNTELLWGQLVLI